MVVRDYPARAVKNAEELIALVLNQEEASFNDVEVADKWTPLPESDVHNPRLAEANAIVAELDYLLSDFPFRPKFKRHASLGTVLQILPARRIVRGFLEPVRAVPFIPYVPPNVMQLITEIPQSSHHKIWREQHGPVGWHYHYVDRDRRRSDTLIAWDTRHPAGEIKRGLFWEFHSERKPQFFARPNEWGGKKRESIYEICRRDLVRPINQFRNPGKGAKVVWPIGSILTP